ncbi:MAG: SUMF1/EgtB/PvdO family nonheme iron enzyme [Chloroflexota bacterium]
MSLEIGDRLQQGRYELTDHLGQGGMGTIYLAIDHNLMGRRVALKENRDTSIQTQEQFRREAILLANLNHPNLPRVTDHFVEESGRQYLVMDYVDGQDLQEISDTNDGPLDEEAVLEWVRQVAGALVYMHNRQDPRNGETTTLLHRDIKPSNIKCTPSGHVVLVDFGLVKVHAAGTGTEAGARAVSPGYSPVEQYTGGTDTRSDIYALGATIYKLLTGQRPPDAPTRAAGAPLVPPREINSKISARTEKAILKAMLLQPDKRYQSIQEMMTDLLGTRFLRDTTATDFLRPDLTVPVQRQRRPVAVGLAVVGLLVGIIGAFLLVRSWPIGGVGTSVANSVTPTSTPMTVASEIVVGEQPKDTESGSSTTDGSNESLNSASSVEPADTSVPIETPIQTQADVQASSEASAVASTVTSIPSPIPEESDTASVASRLTITNSQALTETFSPMVALVETESATAVLTATTISTADMPTETVPAEAATKSPTENMVSTPTSTSAATRTLTHTPTVEPTNSPTLPPTDTITPSATPTSTNIPTDTATHTPTVTPSPTGTPTATETPTQETTATTVPTPEPTLLPTTSSHQPPSTGEVWIHPTDGATYRIVPPSVFSRGNDASRDASPVLPVFVDGFWIMETEVTNAQYTRCIDAGACTELVNNDGWDDPLLAQHPVVQVSWEQAQIYAEWVGGRLPTEAEWEKAARGSDERTFPWGEETPNPERLNMRSGKTVPVGSFPDSASPFGILDMAGNVSEWVADWFDPTYYASAPDSNPKGPESGQLKVIRGGAFNNDDMNMYRASEREKAIPQRGYANIGFRVVQTIE